MGINQPSKAGPITVGPQFEPQHHPPYFTAFTHQSWPQAAPQLWERRPPKGQLHPGPPHCQALGRAVKPPRCPWLPVSFFCPCRTAIVETGLGLGWLVHLCSVQLRLSFFPLKTMNVCL